MELRPRPEGSSPRLQPGGCVQPEDLVPERNPLVNPEGIPIPEDAQDNEFSLADLYHPKSKISPTKKMEVVMAMVMTQSSREASRMTGVNDSTIRWWKTQAIWWPAAEDKCKRDKQDELDAAYTRIIDLGTKNIEDILKNGEHYVKKDGSLGRKPASLRDNYMGVAILQDKRDKVRNVPQFTKQKDTTALLQELLDKFEAHSDKALAKKNIKVISEQ